MNVLIDDSIEYQCFYSVFYQCKTTNFLSFYFQTNIIWFHPFITFFFEEVLLHFSGIPLVFMGKQAQSYNKNLENFHLLNVEHPAAAAYGNREWNNGDLFNWTNNILKQTNQEIEWFQLPF